MTAPSYTGLEVDMLSLGNADSILVTRWIESRPIRVLIDGGRGGDSKTVLAKLQELRVGYLDHVVCTHPHYDHAAGLVGVLENTAVNVGTLWMHLPWGHIDYALLTASLNRANQTKIAQTVFGALNTAQELHRLATARKIPIAEPFNGTYIGPLYVCGPTIEFYRALLLDFADFEKLQRFEAAIVAHEKKMMIEAFASSLRIDGEPLAEDEGELGSEPTDPENDASVILTTQHEGARFLFTADAGVPALQGAVSRYVLDKLNWMQVPHHGSRRNLTEGLVRYFCPKYAFVSADGSRQHPRRKVINAFKAVGATIYSTHYPSAMSLHHSVGTVPDRPGYRAATPL